MKKILLLFISVTLLCITSCSKKSDTDTALTNNQSAKLVGIMVAANSFGLTAITYNLNTFTHSLSMVCGVENTNQFHIAGGNSTVALDYTIYLSTKLKCQVDLPTLSYPQNDTYSGTFTNADYSMNGQGTNNFLVTNVGAGEIVNYMNGTHTNKGTFKLNSEGINGTFDSAIKVTDLRISTTYGSVLGGTATIHITGNASGKGNFTIDGTLTFSETATMLALGNENYIINLATAAVTKL